MYGQPGWLVAENKGRILPDDAHFPLFRHKHIVLLWYVHGKVLPCFDLDIRPQQGNAIHMAATGQNGLFQGLA